MHMWFESGSQHTLQAPTPCHVNTQSPHTSHRSNIKHRVLSPSVLSKSISQRLTPHGPVHCADPLTHTHTPPATHLKLEVDLSVLPGDPLLPPPRGMGFTSGGRVPLRRGLPPFGLDPFGVGSRLSELPSSDPPRTPIP